MSDTVVNTSRVRVESITAISLLTFYFAAFLLYAAVRIISFQSIEEPRLWPDSRVYLKIASEPLWSSSFWAGGRPWTTPLVYKVLRNDLPSIARFQLGLSILCWGLLALAVARAVRSPWIKPIAFGMILLFSLSAEVIMWDGVILSDSISISLMALLIAGGLWLLEGWGWFKAAAVALVAFTWAFARDTNAWILLMIAGALSVGATVRVIQGRYLLLAAAFAVIFAVNDVTANRANRWEVAFMNIVGLRILPSPEPTAYFAARGMPVTPALMERKNKKTWTDNWAFARDPALQSFRDWMYERGKSTYMRFLLSHPAFTIQEPLRHPEELLASELRNYAPVKFSAILKGVLAEAIYPKKWALLWIWAAVLAVGLAVGLRLWTFNPAVVIALLLIVLAYPNAALQWHGDPNEIDRHGLQAGMHLRLGIWLLLIFAADMLVNHNGKTRAVVNDASSKRPARNRS
jgi:hypothetical protein